MRPFTPTAEEPPSDEQLIVDGTLVSCWSWDDHPELYRTANFSTGKKNSTPPSTKSAGESNKRSRTWRILHTDYRRPLTTFADTISAVIGLEFYRAA